MPRNRIKENIKRQQKEYQKLNPTRKKKVQKKWTCPICHMEVNDNFYETWEHIISKH